MELFHVFYPFGEPSAEHPAKFCLSASAHATACLFGVIGSVHPEPDGEVYRIWSFYAGPVVVKFQCIITPRPPEAP